jgi:two-component system, chemotaxis family, sensor kinase Cph1
VSAEEIDLTICDREPIHIPGSIQPHGVMLVTDRERLMVTHAAGDVEAWLGPRWQGATLAQLLGDAVTSTAQRTAASAKSGRLDRVIVPGSDGLVLDATVHRSGAHLLIELEPSPMLGTSSGLLPQLEAAGAAMEQAANLQELCEVAAVEFRRLTGYDRVMVYRFLEDDAGLVLAEDLAPGQHAFLHHHFPASDIPKQARALYVRNLVRVIPDVGYRPVPLRPAWSEGQPLDMSDSILRSVSPVHIQYLKNMGVGASASVSIVIGGVLWGLVACHNDTPRPIAANIRTACRALAAGLARQIRAREETDAYRERVRLRTFEDDIVALLLREGSLNDAISNHVGEFMKMLGSDGVAVLRGTDLVLGGQCPPEAVVRALAAWALDKASETVFATEALGNHYALSEADRAVASGLLAVTLSASDPWIVLWFRAEQVQVVNWAGNPHKNMTLDASGTLNPRASFQAWRETVYGRSRRWILPEIEAAARLRVAVINVWQTRRIRELNRQLLNTLDQKDLLLKQKEFLMGEVNHRVQNSLALVSSFLTLQGKASDDKALQQSLEEARRRITAVSLVHRRLYRADQLEAINAARYIDELLNDLVVSLGKDWEAHLVRDLQPVMLPTDRAVALGLVVNELVTNANKYAYGGAPGPLRVTLMEDRNLFHLSVADRGVGRSDARKGFGTRMMDALVMQLSGTLAFEDAKPGTRATLSAPIELPRR